jgi:hypothetical protein
MAPVVGGKSTTPRKAALRWVGAPRPTEEERGRLVRSDNGETVAETGVDGMDWTTRSWQLALRRAMYSSACKRGHRWHSERLLRWFLMEATRAWHCPLATGGGEVDGASEPRRATWHDGKCQRTLSTGLCMCAGSAR